MVKVAAIPVNTANAPLFFFTIPDIVLELLLMMSVDCFNIPSIVLSSALFFAKAVLIMLSISFLILANFLFMLT